MILDEYNEKFHIACEKKLSFEEGRTIEKHFTEIEKQRADAEKHRADAEKHRADTEKHRADNAALSKNILLLHLKQFSEEQIAQKLNVSIDAVQETLKELDSDVTDLNI